MQTQLTQERIDQQIEKHDKLIRSFRECISKAEIFLQRSALAQSKVNGANNGFSTKKSCQEKQVLSNHKDELATRCSRVYTFLEMLAHSQAHLFNNTNRASLRRAQADIQKVRLWLLDN